MALLVQEVGKAVSIISGPARPFRCQAPATVGQRPNRASPETSGIYRHRKTHYGREGRAPGYLRYDLPASARPLGPRARGEVDTWRAAPGGEWNLVRDWLPPFRPAPTVGDGSGKPERQVARIAGPPKAIFILPPTVEKGNAPKKSTCRASVLEILDDSGTMRSVTRAVSSWLSRLKRVRSGQPSRKAGYVHYKRSQPDRMRFLLAGQRPLPLDGYRTLTLPSGALTEG